MKSLQINKFGNPLAELQITDVPEPGISTANEVKLRVTACCINHSDIAFMKGHYGKPDSFPVIIGCEGVGTVIDIGTEVTKYAIGERVTFYTPRGAWAEYIVLIEEALEKLSPAIDDGTAAQLMINPFTAGALIQEANLQPGQYILLTAGNSSVGRMLTLFAIRAKLKPIAIVSNEDCIDDLLALGLAGVIVYGKENVYHRVNELTAMAGVAAIFDAVAGKLASEAISCLRYGSHMYLYGSMSNERIPLSAHAIIVKNITIKSFQLHHWMNERKARNEKDFSVFKQEVRSFINERNVKLPVAAEYSYNEAAAALQHFGQRGKNGKILLTF